MAGKEGWFGFSCCGLFRLRFISRSSSLRVERSCRSSISTSSMVVAQVGVSVRGGAVVVRVLGLEGAFGVEVGSPFGVIKFSLRGGVGGSLVTL